MKDFKINSTIEVIPSARERFYHGSEDTAVLLIHGYTGSPRGMDYLANRIYKETGFSVYVPRLPGHGTSTADFRQTRARDWLRKVYDSYLNLEARFDTIYVGGLSMGGLLAIMTASNFQVKKLFLISAALYAHSKVLPLTHIVKYFRPVVDNKNNSGPEDYDTDDEVRLFQNYWKNNYTAQAAELHKLMLLARKSLSNITSDTLILASTKDELVPMKAAYTIERSIAASSKELVIFDNSPHVINDGPEKESCADRIVEFLKT